MIIVLLPLFVVVGMVGGWMFTALTCIMLGLAAWEYVGIFRKADLSPSMAVTVGGVLLLMVMRTYFPDLAPGGRSP